MRKFLAMLLIPVSFKARSQTREAIEAIKQIDSIARKGDLATLYTGGVIASSKFRSSIQIPGTKENIIWEAVEQSVFEAELSGGLSNEAADQVMSRWSAALKPLTRSYYTTPASKTKNPQSTADIYLTMTLNQQWLLMGLTKEPEAGKKSYRVILHYKTY